VTRGIPQPCKAEALADRRYVAERQRAKSGEQQVSHLNDHSGAGNEISKESEEKKPVYQAELEQGRRSLVAC